MTKFRVLSLVVLSMFALNTEPLRAGTGANVVLGGVVVVLACHTIVLYKLAKIVAEEQMMREKAHAARYQRWGLI